MGKKFFDAGKKRGIVFSIDAILALSLFIAVLPLIEAVYVQSVSHSLVHEQLHLQSEDVASVLVKITVAEEMNESAVLQQLYAQGKIKDSDLDRPLIDAIGMFWAANTSADLAIAESIMSDTVGNATPLGASWQALFAGDEIASRETSQNSSAFGTAASKRIVSGFEKNKTLEGCTARAFLERVTGRQESKQFFFGGFVGQGNLTATVKGVPSDANVSLIYLEANFGDNFSLYVNGNFCAGFNRTLANYSVDSFSLENSSYPNCIGNVSKGADNYVYLNFTGNDSTRHFVGGGFIKISYDSSLLSSSQASVSRYNFPGIKGIINLYDSFYVPGNVSNVTAYLDFFAEQPAYLVVGNTTIFNLSGNSSLQNFTISNSSFAANFSNDYSQLSGKTVPVRFGTLAAISGNASGNADVILITDNSGSMAWRVDSDSTTNVSSCTNCTDPCINQSNVRRINKAKCLDKEFVDNILNLSGNRVGLVAFTDDADASYDSLSTNSTYLKSRVDSYVASGGTCVCCAINRAYQLANASYNYTIISRSSTWEYNASFPLSAPPLDSESREWTNKSYNISWASGAASLGFGGATTDIGSDLQFYSSSQANASNYLLATGALSAGSLSDANAQDASTLDLQFALDGVSQKGMVAYQISAPGTTPKYSVWNGTEWLSSANAQATGGGGSVQWMALASNPTNRSEKILATLDSQSDVYAQVWNGTAWGANALMAATAPSNARRQFDLAYEQQSGEAVIVYINGTAQQVQFRVYNGTEWGSEQLLSIGTAGTQNARVRLHSHNNSDELMLLVETEATSTYGDLYASYWNGNSFGAANSLEVNVADLTGQAFDGAWEPSGSEFVLFYSDTASNNIKYRNYTSASGWQAESSGFSGGSGAIRSVRVAAYPSSENLMACWQEYSATDLDCQMWNGTQVGTGREQETSMEVYAPSTTTVNFDVAPVLGTGGFVVMYGDSNDDWFEFYLCNSAANCFAGTYTTAANTEIQLWASTQMGGTDTAWGAMIEDYNNPGNITIIGSSQTAASGWYRAQIYCNSTSCYSQGNWVSLGGATTSVAYESAAFSFDSHRGFGLDARFNATINPANLSTLNATVVFNSTASATYSLRIFNYASSAWETSQCQSTAASPSAWATISCNVSAHAANYLSPQNTSTISLYAEGQEVQMGAKVDFVQFHYSNASGNYFFKKTFSLPRTDDVETLSFTVYSDDAADIYLNGFLVDSDLGSHDAAWNRTVSANVSNLTIGNNTVAVMLRNNDNSSAKFDLELNATQKRAKFIIMMTDGQTGYQCSPSACDGTLTQGYSSCGAACTGTGCDCAISNANYSSCRAAALPSTVYSIGFGPVSTCSNGNKTLQQVAACGGGAYYYSSNSSELQDIYTNLAQVILNQTITFTTQVANVSGNATNMTLYPDSYLEFQYASSAPAPQFRQITISSETDAFSNCTGSFYIPRADSIDEVKITSYSQDFWTSQVNAKNDSGVWQNAFNLSEYASKFDALGDPFAVQLDPALFKTNSTNQVNITTASNSTNQSSTCSANNKAFFSYRVTLPATFSPVLANCTGKNATVYFDKTGDGIADGTLNISFGTVQNATPIAVDSLDPATNAADYAFLKLLDALNFDNATDSTAITSGRSGAQGNPIDVQIPSALSVDATPISGIPFMWGPAEVQVAMRT